MSPKISVILPVFNAQSYLRESIDSILSQSFQDFELIIINDGSTDQSLSIMKSYTDPRIRIIHQANAGLPISLNRGIAIAQGQYLARQDADDISLPERFSKQVAYLDANPQCALLGTWAQILVENALTERSLSHPHLNGDIQLKLPFFNCFVHSSVMIRKSILKNSGVYPEDPEKFPPEDYDLWLRIARNAEVANLPEMLLHYREVPSSISRTKLEIMQNRAELMSLLEIQSILPKSIDADALKGLIKAMTSQRTDINRSQEILQHEWLTKIAAYKKSRFPASAPAIEQSLLDCKRILSASHQKSRINRIASYLPFDIIPLLKRIKNQWHL